MKTEYHQADIQRMQAAIALLRGGARIVPPEHKRDMYTLFRIGLAADMLIQELPDEPAERIMEFAKRVIMVSMMTEDPRFTTYDLLDAVVNHKTRLDLKRMLSLNDDVLEEILLAAAEQKRKIYSDDVEPCPMSSYVRLESVEIKHPTAKTSKKGT